MTRVKLTKVAQSGFPHCTRVVCSDGMSVHVGENGHVVEVWRHGYKRQELVPLVDDWAAHALAYHDLTGSVEGFPEQEFDL